MAAIYSRATRLTIWLGEGASYEDDQAVLLVLEEILISRKDHDYFDGLDGADRYPRITEIFNSLLKRRYFSRRWILQELYHSKEETALLYWGHCHIPLACLHIALVDYVQLLPWYQGPVAECPFASQAMFDVLYGILRYRDTLAEQDCSPDEEDVIDRLKDVNFLECSDDRDRLYALLSLQNNHIMEADYTLTTVEVYVRFATYVIRHKRSERIFDNCHVGDAHQRLAGLPSWVPDLRNHFRAARHMNEDRWGEVFVDDHNVLKYHAKYLGRVTGIYTEATGIFDGRCFYLTIADQSYTPSDQPDHPSACGLQIQGEGGGKIMLDDVICTASPTNTEQPGLFTCFVEQDIALSEPLAD